MPVIDTIIVTIQPLQVYVNELKMSGLGSPHPWGEDLGGGLFVACRPPPRPSPRRVRVPLWYIVLNINKIQIIIGQSGLNSYTKVSVKRVKLEF